MRDFRKPDHRPASVGLLTICALCIAVACADAQSLGDGDVSESSFYAQPTPIPLTYDPKTVTSQAPQRRTLSHAVIVGVGSLPFSVFYVDFVFDFVRFAANGFDVSYAPWPFKNQYSASVETDERFLRLGVSVGVSAVVGLLDLLLPSK